MDKKVFKQIKIVGLVAFIPLVLAAGPLTAYVAADYLRRRFGLSPVLFFLIVCLGFLSSVLEIVRLVQKAIQLDKEQ